MSPFVPCADDWIYHSMPFISVHSSICVYSLVYSYSLVHSYSFVYSNPKGPRASKVSMRKILCQMRVGGRSVPNAGVSRAMWESWQVWVRGECQSMTTSQEGPSNSLVPYTCQWCHASLSTQGIQQTLRSCQSLLYTLWYTRIVTMHSVLWARRVYGPPAIAQLPKLDAFCWKDLLTVTTSHLQPRCMAPRPSKIHLLILLSLQYTMGATPPGFLPRKHIAITSVQLEFITPFQISDDYYICCCKSTVSFQFSWYRWWVPFAEHIFHHVLNLSDVSRLSLPHCEHSSKHSSAGPQHGPKSMTCSL